MDTLVDLVTGIGAGIRDFFDSVLNFLYLFKLLPQFLEELLKVLFGSNSHFFAWLFAKLIELFVLAYFTLMSYLTPFVWDIAKVMVNDLYAASNIQAYASSLPPGVNALFDVLGLYKAVDIVLTAYFTRFVFKLIPFVGR